MSNKIQEKYLRDMVYGSVDGIITTFAVVSGVVGAGLSYGIIIILGFANLIADGISMAASNYASNKSEIQKINNKRQEHRKSIRESPELKERELMSLLYDDGFERNSAEMVKDELTKNEFLWEKILILRQFGEFEHLDPRKTATATFLAFVLAGTIPLAAFVAQYIWPNLQPYSFQLSILFTCIALFLVGVIKGKIVNKSSLRSGLETLFIGGVAASVAFLVGSLLSGFAG